MSYRSNIRRPLLTLWPLFLLARRHIDVSVFHCFTPSEPRKWIQNPQTHRSHNALLLKKAELILVYICKKTSTFIFFVQILQNCAITYFSTSAPNIFPPNSGDLWCSHRFNLLIMNEHDINAKWGLKKILGHSRGSWKHCCLMELMNWKNVRFSTSELMN